MPIWRPRITTRWPRNASMAALRPTRGPTSTPAACGGALAGRPPFPGGNALAAPGVCRPRPADVRTLAPRCRRSWPRQSACLRRDPRERPASPPRWPGGLDRRPRKDAAGWPDPSVRAAAPQRSTRRLGAPVRPRRRGRSRRQGGAGRVCRGPLGIGLPAPAPSGNSGNSGEAVSRGGSPPPMAELPAGRVRDLVEDRRSKPPPTRRRLFSTAAGRSPARVRRRQPRSRPGGWPGDRSDSLRALAVRERRVVRRNRLRLAGGLAIRGWRTPAMLRIAAGRVRFRRCTFQAASAGPGRRLLHWVFPSTAGTRPPTGKLVLADCVFHRVARPSTPRTAASLAIECDNLLHLGPGPLVRSTMPPRRESRSAWC